MAIRYPQLTQEMVLDVMRLFQAIYDGDNLRTSTYSEPMKKTILDTSENFHRFMREKFMKDNEFILDMKERYKLANVEYYESERKLASESRIEVARLQQMQKSVGNTEELLKQRERNVVYQEKEIKNSEKALADREDELNKKKDALEELEHKLNADKDFVKAEIERNEALQIEVKSSLSYLEAVERFKKLGVDLETKSEEYKESFGLIIRLEQLILKMSITADTAKTESVRLNATKSLMDYQQQQISALERIRNIDRVDKIEGLTRKFFLELKKHPALKTVAERYLSLVDNI